MSILAPPVRPEIRRIYERVGTIVEQGSFGTTNTGGWTFETSTFSGWGTVIGAVQGLKGVRFYARSWDPTKEISRIRCRIKTVNHSGTILANKTVDVSVPLGVDTLVEVEFDTIIENAANDVLWLEWNSDGRSGIRHVTTGIYTSPPYEKVRYFANSDPASMDASLQASGSQLVQYCEFFTRDEALPQVVIGEAFVGDLFKRSAMQRLFQAQFINEAIEDNAATIFSSFESSTFSGWGQAIGSPQNFDQIEINIRSWDANTPVTLVRVRVRENDQDGTVLLDKTVAFSSPVGVFKKVIVNSDQPIANTSDTPLWLEYFTNGKCGINNLAAAVYPTPKLRYSTAQSTTITTTIEVTSAAQNFWWRVALRDSQIASFEPTEELLGVLNLGTSVTADAEILMPSTLRLVAGREFNVYFEAVMKSTIPYNQWDWDVAATPGAQWDNFWRVPASGTGSASAGTTTLTLSMYYWQKLIAQKAISLNVVASTNGNGVTRKCLFIGDSLTAANFYTAELVTLFAADVMNISLLGTIGSGSNFHEGVSGKTFAYHYSDPLSNFVFSGSFDFAQYLSTNGFTMAANDWVFFQLGINDVFNLTPDNIDASIDAILATAQSMIAGIQATVPGIRIGIGLVTPSAAQQNAFGDDYFNGQPRWKFEINRRCFISKVIEKWGASEGSKIYLVPVHANLDLYNNFPTGSQAFNSRNATTRTIQTNGVHPALSGYQQMADSYYHFIKNLA